MRRLWIDGERHERGYAIEWSVLNAKGKKVGGGGAAYRSDSAWGVICGSEGARLGYTLARIEGGTVIATVRGY